MLNRKNNPFPKIRILVIVLMLVCTSSVVYASNYLDTQYGPDGLEFHLLKASVANNVLTIAFMVENTNSEEVTMMSLGVAETLYATADKKYPVLQDINGKWLASTTTYVKNNTEKGFIFADNPGSGRYIKIGVNERKVGWVKFELADDVSWPIEVSLPGVSPFTIENLVHKNCRRSYNDK